MEGSRMNKRPVDLHESYRRLRRLTWVLIVLVILSGVTGVGAARYYAAGLRKAQHDSCVDSRKARIVQRDSNAKTQAFLRIAQFARATAAKHETGEKRRSDRATARLYKAVADSYAPVAVPDCGLGPPPPLKPLPKLPRSTTG
jgi:hypothetical protein